MLWDNFTRWQEAVAILEATPQVVASALNERVFCYLGIPEQTHTNQSAQFDSQRMDELCQLWKVSKKQITFYYLQAIWIVERNNRTPERLFESHVVGMRNGNQEEWDELLPQIMRVYRGTPYTVTGETAIFMMFGKEFCLPHQSKCHPPLPAEVQSASDYVL
ncbi:uncharacterized protein [Watersipora subatra]|uniref:uncharacterized protein n=1 Tax=Watersipora subatra TaxID=2589382 RepID=UPI00355BEF5E